MAESSAISSRTKWRACALSPGKKEPAAWKKRCWREIRNLSWQRRMPPRWRDKAELWDLTCCWRQLASAVVAAARAPPAEAQALTVAAELEAAAFPGQVDREGLPAGAESEERARIR